MTRMRVTRTRLGLLGLCAVVLGAMAFSASAAQGAATWLVNKVVLPEALLPTLGANLDGGDLSFLGTLVGIKFHILCKEIELKETHLVAPAKVLGFMVLSKCEVLELLADSTTMVLSKCNIPEGKLTTVKMVGSIVLHEGNGAVEFKPEVGTNIMTFNMGPECPTGENVKIGGILRIRDCVPSEFLTDKVTHLIESPKLGLNASGESNELFLNGNKKVLVTLDGSANVFLTGVAHTGLTFAGHPE